MPQNKRSDDYGMDVGEVFDAPPACALCVHWVEGTRLCMAFKDSPIPDEIWKGGDPHDEPFPGDNGIRFEEISV